MKRTCGAAFRIAFASSADALTRCSQLSITNSTRRVLRKAHSVWISGRSGSSRSAQRLGRLADHQRGVADRREIEEPDPVRVLRHDLGRHLQREPGLAQPAHAQQRQQPHAGQALLDLAEFALAPDERRHLVGQVVRDLGHRQPALAGAHDAVDLLAVRRRDERRVRPAGLEQLDRLRDALHHPVPVRLDLQTRLAQRLARFGGEQQLAAARERHHARRRRLGQAVDLERLGTARDIVGAVLAQDHRADMQPRARLQRHRQRRESAVVFERIAHRVGGGVEQQQHAVGLVDLAAAPDGQQVARETVVGGPHGRHRMVAEFLGQLGAVDHVGQQQSPDFTHFACRLLGWQYACERPAPDGGGAFGARLSRRRARAPRGRSGTTRHRPARTGSRPSRSAISSPRSRA